MEQKKGKIKEIFKKKEKTGKKGRMGGMKLIQNYMPDAQQRNSR